MIPGIAAVAEFSLGVEIEGGRIIGILRAGSPLPAIARRLFTTVSDSQTAVDINIMARRATRTSSMGRLLLSGISQSRKGDARIEIAVLVDRESLVRVRARDLDSGAIQRAAFSLEPAVWEGEEGLTLRITALIARVREEATRLPPGSVRLFSELHDVMSTSYLSVARKNTEDMAGCVTALETILGEIITITRGRQMSVFKPVLREASVG